MPCGKLRHVGKQIRFSVDINNLIDVFSLLWSSGLFIIDGRGILRQITMNDLPVGRSVDETLRLLQAFQYTDKHGEGQFNEFYFYKLHFFCFICFGLKFALLVGDLVQIRSSQIQKKNSSILVKTMNPRKTNCSCLFRLFFPLIWKNKFQRKSSLLCWHKLKSKS